MVGFVLALLSQACWLLISSGAVQICTPSGSDRGQFEVAVWCDGSPAPGAARDAEIRTGRGTHGSLGGDACQHCLRAIEGRRTDRELASLPPALALPLLWTLSEVTGGDDLPAARLDACFTVFRPSERSASPLGLPRPPPSQRAI
jgi:hypothetical protein